MADVDALVVPCAGVTIAVGVCCMVAGCCFLTDGDEIGIPLVELATELGDGDASPPAPAPLLPSANLALPKIFSIDDEFDEGGLNSPYSGDVILPFCCCTCGSGCLTVFDLLGNDNLPNKDAAIEEEDDMFGESWFLE